MTDTSLNSGLRVLIVDDEGPARKRLHKLMLPLIQSGRIHVAGEASDGIEALDWLTNHSADLVFLDIQMPGLDGFEVLDRLPPSNRPIVVFTTAYDAYALKAFEAHALDYLLKPITAERLEQAVERTERFHSAPDEKDERNDQMARLLDWLDAQATTETEAAPKAESLIQQLSIPYRDRILIVPVDQLVSVEINEGITRVYILEEPGTNQKQRLRQHIVSYTLDQLDARLDPQHFMRVHRSAIVQFNHIRELIPWFSGRYKLVLSGNHEVIASRERSKMLKDRLMI